MTGTPTYERFAHNWGNGTSTKLAIGADYDEQLVSRLKSLDWEDTHVTYEGEYQFLNNIHDEEGAWAVDADPATLSTVRDRTGLGIPPAGECPINPRPFGTDDSAIEIIQRSLSSLSRTCHRCQADSVVSWHDYLGVYKSAQSLHTELLLDPEADPTHLCLSCNVLLTVPTDERSFVAKAMGESA